MDEATRHHKGATRLSGAPDTWPLSALDASRLAGVSERTIRRAIARGEILATKHAGVYRVSQVDLDRYRARTGRSVWPDQARGAHQSRMRPFLGRGSLPSPPTPLIGREDVRATARDLLLGEHARLVTLTGPGGVGKTHLALQCAADVADHFIDGAHFVDLSTVRDPDAVLARIAQAVGVRAAGRRNIDEMIAAFLHRRHLLLVLDNCEHVLAAAPRIAALSAGCPALQILATSRAPLHLRGEHRLHIPPLPVPASAGIPVDQLVGTGSVQLFLERARSVNPMVVPAAGDLQAISEICRRLDGLPLAIELAAARSAVLPPRALLEQISHGLRVLTNGPRDLPDRHRTIRNAIAWSYNLLTSREQALLRRVAVFVGGFDLEAAHAVAGPPHDDVLDRIEAIVEQSLLGHAGRSGDGERFTLLETVREFALREAREQGELDDLRQLHARFFLELAERLEAATYGPHMRRCLDRFGIEYHNCQAALAYFAETGDSNRELRLAAMLSEHWFYRGQISEGIAALGSAVDRGINALPGPRSKAMTELAFLQWATGANDKALSTSAACLPLAREAGDVYRLAQALLIRSNTVGSEEGRRSEAITILQEVVELVQDHEPPLEIYQSALADLGWQWVQAGEREHGVALLREALVIFIEQGHHLETGWAFLRLGRLDRQEGKTRQAAAHYGESLRAFREAGIVTQTGFALSELAQLASMQGDVYSAAHFLGMIRAIGERTGATFDDELTEVARHVNRETTDGVFAAMEAGHSLPFIEAIERACEIADVIAAGEPLPSSRALHSAHTPFPLSARELEILALLVQRHTATEIAAHLYISVRTVERHVANLYDKLGVNSRTEASAIAARHGLL